MELLIAIIVGAIIGVIASIITDTREGMIANILVGIIGSALGRWVFGTVLGIGSAGNAGNFSWSGLFWGVIGSVVLIALLRAFNVFGYGGPREE